MAKSITSESKSSVTAPGKSSSGVSAFVCGILGIFIPIIGLVLSIIAINLAAKQRDASPTSLARAGFVLGIIGIVLQWLIIMYVVLVAVATMSQPL